MSGEDGWLVFENDTGRVAILDHMGCLPVTQVHEHIAPQP